MYLYNVKLDRGRAVVAAERPSQVLAIIRQSMFFEEDFIGCSDKDILKEIEELVGYKVEGNQGVTVEQIQVELVKIQVIIICLF